MARPVGITAQQYAQHQTKRDREQREQHPERRGMPQRDARKPTFDADFVHLQGALAAGGQDAVAERVA